MKTSNLLFILLAMIGSNTVNAQDKSNDTTARYFIIQASIGNLQEVAIGRLAAQQAASPDVKAFANRMVTDHSKAEAQLMELIKSRGFQICPTNPAGLERTPRRHYYNR